MALSENDLVASLLKSPAYVEAIEEEMLPDDTMDMLQGSRRGKNEVKFYDHILGVSELQTRQKAKQ